MQLIQINAHLNEKDVIEENEFHMIEQMLKDDSKLTVTECENILNLSDKASTNSNSSVIENYHAAVRLMDPSQSSKKLKFFKFILSNYFPNYFQRIL